MVAMCLVTVTVVTVGGKSAQHISGSFRMQCSSSSDVTRMVTRVGLQDDEFTTNDKVEALALYLFDQDRAGLKD